MEEFRRPFRASPSTSSGRLRKLGEPRGNRTLIGGLEDRCPVPLDDRLIFTLRAIFTARLNLAGSGRVELPSLDLEASILPLYYQPVEMVGGPGIQPRPRAPKARVRAQHFSPIKIGTRGGTWTHNLFRATLSKSVTYAFRHSGMEENRGVEPRHDFHRVTL